MNIPHLRRLPPPPLHPALVAAKLAGGDWRLALALNRERAFWKWLPPGLWKLPGPHWRSAADWSYNRIRDETHVLVPAGGPVLATCPLPIRKLRAWLQGVRAFYAAMARHHSAQNPLGLPVELATIVASFL